MKADQNTCVGENILLRFLRDENGDFWNRISEAVGRLRWLNVLQLFLACPPTIVKAWFKRRILHVPNRILILVDSNEYVRLIWFKRRVVLPNKIAEREWCVLNSHLSKHKLFNIIPIQFGACKMQRLNQLSKFSRIFDWISRIFDWLATNWNMSHLSDLDVAFYMHLIWQFHSAQVKCDV